ncbi:uncharacterized protein LOC131843387 [Achroia grisella]|uniref:uncharacterized protein LOC131843387 n=1 Tax=Achroia grisella TaxID=688607 RepID=UPI0027D28F28|nr:uncharacterized protein LOC131843387 [Achroia grisella]
MANFCICVSLIILFSFDCNCITVKQERAVVKYYNKEHIRYAQAFTGRSSRREPYKTNITAVILHPWNNNVTLKMIYKSKRMTNDFIISVRVCDALNLKWLSDFLSVYARYRLICPFPAGEYNLENIELPPKHLPVQLFTSEGQLEINFSLTKTKQIILVVTIQIQML